MLELHVWGPGFGLPSIDPHCLAAIAYLQQAVPKRKWQLIASSDTSLSPSNELPALRNGDIWIGGFRNIFHYIAQHSGGEWILDAGLPEESAADCVAFSSFIESSGQPLLDLSLFVSTINYTATTRPLYNKIQSFPLPYLTPPALRSAAKARTAHLNLDSLDIDSSAEESPPSQSFIPERLRKPKNTVSSMLAANPEAVVGIRLDSLARAFLEPLKDLKRKKQFLVSDSQFTSLDCLALGYLSLMLIPELPQPWLSRIIKDQFPSLASWTERLGKMVFGQQATLYDAFLASSEDSGRNDANGSARGEGHLPWTEPTNTGFSGVGSAFAAGIVDMIPVLGQVRRNNKQQHYSAETVDKPRSNSASQNLTIFGSLVAVLGLGVGYLFHQGILALPAGEEEKREGNGGLHEFGEAGAALSVLVGQMDRPGQVERNYSHGEPVVELDVDLKGGGVETMYGAV